MLGAMGGGGDVASTVVQLLGADGFLNGLRQMEGGWGGVDRAQDRASQSAARYHAASKAFLMTGGTIAGAALMMSKSTLEAAGSNEAYIKTFEALTKSASQARAIFGFIDKSSLSSVFGRKELLEAGQLLTAYGQDVKRFLPLSDDLAAAFAAQGVKAADVARVFGRLSAGDFGEAFERLRDFGISRKELEGKGLTFDGGGQYTGSVEKALAAVESIVQKRFKGLSKKMATETLTGAVSNFTDALDRLKSSAGESLLPGATETIKQLTTLIDKGNQFLKMNPEFSKKALKASAWAVGLMGAGAVASKGVGLYKTVTGKRGGGALDALGGSNVGVMTVNAAVVNVMGGGGIGAPGGLANRAGGALGTAYDLAAPAAAKTPWWKTPLKGAGFGAFAATTVAGAAVGTAVGYGAYKVGQATGLVDRKQTFRDRMATGWGRARDLVTGNVGNYDREMQREEGKNKRLKDLARVRKEINDMADREGWDAHKRRIMLLKSQQRVEDVYQQQFRQNGFSKQSDYLGKHSKELGGEIKFAEREQGAARSVAFNAGAAQLRSQREAYDNGENVPGFVTNTAPTGTPKREDWDERTRQIAELFGQSQSSDGGGGLGNVTSNRDGSNTVTLPVRASDTFVKTLDRNNSYSQPIAP